MASRHKPRSAGAPRATPKVTKGTSKATKGTSKATKGIAKGEGDLVPISRARLGTWIIRRDLSRAEVARRAGMRPQKLHHIVSGNVARIREEYLERLADVLHVSVPFLRGDQEAPGPGGSTAVIQPVVDPAAQAVVPGRRDWSRVQSEQEAVATEVGRVFLGVDRALADESAEFAETLRSQGAADRYEQFMEWQRRPSPGQNAGATFFLSLERLQRFVSGGAVVGQIPQPVLDQFATDVARVVRAILEPWTSGRAPLPPAGARATRAIVTLAREIGFAITGYVQREPERVEAILGEMEEMAARIQAIREGP